MAVEITIPSPGESVTEVVLGPWQKQSGDWVQRDEPLVEIESDKVTLEVPAPDSGVLDIVANEGDEMNVGDVIGRIDTSAEKPAGQDGDSSASASSGGGTTTTQDTAIATSSSSNGASGATPEAGNDGAREVAQENDNARATSVARKIAADKGVNLASVTGTGPSGRITKSDVLAISDTPTATAATSDNDQVAMTVPSGRRGVRRERMSKLRARIAERLVDAQHTAAMLTTFNEADMTEVMALRKRFKETFAETHGVNLGFMSFFVKACVTALQKFPRVNASIDGGEIEFHDYCDVSVAVGTPKGLVVPVLRNAEQMSFADVESTIRDLAIRARDGKLSIDEMTGGTFTISNGGVYGSLNSTPILNPPQSGILGMHKIMNRAVEHPDVPGEIALRPMMYLALSYDHRIVDGAEAVGFLVQVKDCIENPERLLLGL